MSENNIEKLSACTNLDVVDKINELIDKVNIPDSIEIEAGELDRNLLKATSNFHCKLTVITKRKSVLIFAVTNDGDTKEVKPIFVESNSTEDQAEFKAGSNKEFIYISTDNDIQIHYSQACIVIFDGLHGTYTERDTNALNKSVAVGSKPSEWLSVVPSTVTKTDDSNWLTVTATYDNNGKANEFQIGFNDAAVLGAIQDLNEQIQRDLAIIIESLSELTDEDTRINGRIDELSEALSALDLRVSTNETNISNISSTVSNLSTTVGSLSTTVSQHTTAIDALDGRLDDVESDISDIKDKNSEQDDRLDDIEDELANLDKSICKDFIIDHTKEYTRVGRFRLPELENDVVSDFSIEIKIVTDNEDELEFALLRNTAGSSEVKDIQLFSFTNKSYKNISRNISAQTGGELVIYDLVSDNGINYVDVYLKRYNSDRDTQVSTALINKVPNEIKFVASDPDSKDYGDFSFSGDTIILEADDEFKHAMHPIIAITTDTSVTAVSDEFAQDATTQLIYRKVTVPTATQQTIHTLTVHDKSKASGATGESTTYDPASANQSVDALSEVKTVANGGISGNGTNSNPLSVDATNLEFDETQFEVSHVTTPADKTIIKLKNSSSGGTSAYQCEARIEYNETYQAYVATITKDDQTISVAQMYDLVVNQGIQPSIKITWDSSGKIGIGAIFTLSNEYSYSDEYSLMFTNVNWNGIPSIIHGQAFDSIDVWLADTTSPIINLGTYYVGTSSFDNRAKFELPGLTSSSTDEEYIAKVKEIYSQINMVLASGLTPQLRYHVLDNRSGYSTEGRKEIATGYYMSAGCYNCFIFFSSANSPDTGMWSDNYILVGWYPESKTVDGQVIHYKWWTVSFNGYSGGAEEDIPE